MINNSKSIWSTIKVYRVINLEGYINSPSKDKSKFLDYIATCENAKRVHLITSTAINEECAKLDILTQLRIDCNIDSKSINKAFKKLKKPLHYKTDLIDDELINTYFIIIKGRLK